MPRDVSTQPNSWPRKFRCALRGIAWGCRSQRSFAVQLVAAAAVVLAAAALGASRIEWCLLVLCMATVLAAELLNTAIEHLARAITHEPHDELRDALDTSSGAVLLLAVGAAVAGGLIFVHRLIVIFP